MVTCWSVACEGVRAVDGNQLIFGHRDIGNRGMLEAMRKFVDVLIEQ